MIGCCFLFFYFFYKLNRLAEMDHASMAAVIVPASMEHKIKTEFHTLRANIYVVAQTNNTDLDDVSGKNDIQTIVRKRRLPVCLLHWLRADDKFGPG